MTAPPRQDTDELLRRVADGDREARGPLLDRHADRLRRMVALRLDPRVKARVDPSDVVQESLAEADGKLSDYARTQPVPFYPWLRQIAWEFVVRTHRRHLRVKGRSVRREEPRRPALPDESVSLLAEKLVANGSTPSAHMERAEQQIRLRAGLALLSDQDREILVLRYLEDMSVREIAAVLELTESAVKMRQLRALQRLRDLMEKDGEGQS